MLSHRIVQGLLRAAPPARFEGGRDVIFASTRRDKAMRRASHVLASIPLLGSLGTSALAFDELIPGRKFVTKPGGKLVKFLSKSTGTPYPMPSSNPGFTTNTLQVLDTGGAGGNNTYSITGVWKPLGGGLGQYGWKYKGADPCIVIIKPKVIKAVCKDKGGGGVTLAPPFSGTAGVILSVGSDRYCGEWGGTTLKNDTKLIKRKGAAAPSSCPE